MLFVSFFFKATATFNYWIKGPELGSSASGENGPQFLHSVRCVQSTYVYRGARHLRQSTINIVKCCILWLLVVWRVRVCVNTPSSPDTSTTPRDFYGISMQTWRSDREEWELSSPKSYYLVDHAMTGPQFHRHLHRAPSTGGGAVTQPDNTEAEFCRG